MESKNDLNQKILKATLNIQDNFPELIKHLDEMQEHFLSTLERKIYHTDLKGYLDSLNQLLKTSFINQ